MANKSGMERTSDLIRHIQAARKIIRAAMTGGIYAAAIQTVKHYWPVVLAIVLILLFLPLLLFLCLPAMLFGFGSSTSDAIADMNTQAARVKSFYSQYETYCNERIKTIENSVINSGVIDDTVHQEPSINYEYEISIEGGPMAENWFVSLHSVLSENDLNVMTEQSVKDFVEKSIVYTVEDKITESTSDETQSPPQDDTVHETPGTGSGEVSSKPEQKKERLLTIRYLTPTEFMSVCNFSNSDQNWAQLMVQTLSGGNSSGNGGNIVDVAVSQIGNIGGEPYWSWYGFGQWENWCACFISWCADQCGYIDAGIIPKFAVCNMDFFIGKGEIYDRNYLPKAGDIIFFDWESDGLDGKEDHVGVVESCDGTTVYTIEGNTGGGKGKVSRNQYPVGYYEIFGYCSPYYPDFSASAEPSIQTN